MKGKDKFFFILTLSLKLHFSSNQECIPNFSSPYLRFSFPIPIQTSRKRHRGRRETGEMEEELSGMVPCSSLAVDSILRVGTAGAIWGSFVMLVKDVISFLSCLTGVAHASFVPKTIGNFGFQCGLVAGLFTVTRCGIQGAVAGAAVAARTRSWTQVVGIIGLVSVFSVAAEYCKTF